jgi:hypothetical protein
MRVFVSAAIIAAVLNGTALARTYDEIMAEAEAAFAKEDFAAAGALLDEAQVKRPYSLFLTRNRILTRMLTGRDEEALAIAKSVADRGLVLETPKHEAFDRLKALPSWRAIAAQMDANAQPIGAAVVVAEYSEAGLLPEAISHRNGRLLIGSVRTGAVFDAGQTLSPLAELDGGVFDIEQRRKSVFAAISNQLAYERRGEESPSAAVVEMDAKTGAERRRILMPAAGALIGDIEIDGRGTLYASDSLVPRLFIAGKKDEAARLFASDDRWANLQGIAIDEKHGRLLLADYLTGLYVVDLKDGAVRAIGNPSDAYLGGIDGLYLYDGDLICVQNGVSPQRIVRIQLDRTGGAAERLDVLAGNLEGWAEPTHGVIVGDEFVYIATSNWPAYNDDGDLRDGANLAPLRIMSLRLD